MTKERSRLPPGQHKIDRFPVLQHNQVLHIDRANYKLIIDGLVENPKDLTLEQLKQLSKKDETVDIHCVTSWSKFDMNWGC